MNKQKEKRFRQVAGWVCIVISFIATLVLRLMNMDMTETRLFIEFWPLWILIVANVFMGYKWLESSFR